MSIAHTSSLSTMWKRVGSAVDLTRAGVYAAVTLRAAVVRRFADEAPR
jgi:hypothetical protein